MIVCTLKQTIQIKSIIRAFECNVCVDIKQIGASSVFAGFIKTF